MPHRAGRMLADRYRLESLIGEGGMASVYRASHTWMGRAVAVKLLRPELVGDTDIRRRFVREAKLVAGLRHAHVVEILDMGEDDDGGPFIVFELLEGDSLGSHLERETTMTPEAATAALVPVMAALQVAHERQILHRDLKPANIFLARDGLGGVTPKLLDFGVAKVLHGGSIQTLAGSVLGTIGYMSPEQVTSRPDIGPATDVWGLGMVWLRALSGRLPIRDGANMSAQLADMYRRALPPLGELAPGIPPHLGAAVDGALQRAPEARHPSMDAFLDAVLDACARDGIPSRDPRDPRDVGRSSIV